MVAALGCHAPLEAAVWSSRAFEDAAIASPFQIGWCFLALQITPARWPCQGAPNPRIASACRLCKIDRFFLFLLLFRHLNDYFLPSESPSPPSCDGIIVAVAAGLRHQKKKKRIQFCKKTQWRRLLGGESKSSGAPIFPETPDKILLSKVELLLGFEIERRRKIIVVT